MYELEYVKKRKRKKRVVIIGGISTIVISVFAIVAFLGRYVGTFTVTLNTGRIGLTLSQKSDFSNSTSYLRIGDLPPFREFTYGDFDPDSVIDSEATAYNVGVDESGIMNYFKYTFFLKNAGTAPCQYDFHLNILENNLASDGRGLDNTLRIALYDNKDLNSHVGKKVYAKRAQTPHDNDDYSSPVSVYPWEATSDYPFEGYAEIFESNSTVVSRHEPVFEVGEIRRYTIVFWLEGFRSSSEELAPLGAKLKLGVDIKAYEI